MFPRPAIDTTSVYDVSDSDDSVTLSYLSPRDAVDAPDAQQCWLQVKTACRVTDLQLFTNMLVI